MPGRIIADGGGERAEKADDGVDERAHSQRRAAEYLHGWMQIAREQQTNWERQGDVQHLHEKAPTLRPHRATMRRDALATRAGDLPRS